jgi:hypothetical protein
MNNFLSLFSGMCVQMDSRFYENFHSDDGPIDQPEIITKVHHDENGYYVKLNGTDVYPLRPDMRGITQVPLDKIDTKSLSVLTSRMAARVTTVYLSKEFYDNLRTRIPGYQGPTPQMGQIYKDYLYGSVVVILDRSSDVHVNLWEHNGVFPGVYVYSPEVRDYVNPRTLEETIEDARLVNRSAADKMDVGDVTVTITLHGAINPESLITPPSVRFQDDEAAKQPDTNTLSFSVLELPNGTTYISWQK